MKSSGRKISSVIMLRLFIAVFSAFIVSCLVTYTLLFIKYKNKARNLLEETCFMIASNIEMMPKTPLKKKWWKQSLRSISHRVKRL